MESSAQQPPTPLPGVPGPAATPPLPSEDEWLAVALERELREALDRSAAPQPQPHLRRLLELGPAPVLVRLDTVPEEPVRWLWPGRIPRGKLTLLAGDPGLGKSLLALDLAARLSRGLPLPDDGDTGTRGHGDAETPHPNPLPGGEGVGTAVSPCRRVPVSPCRRVPASPAATLLLSAEDGLADTIVPRLRAAGADLARVTVLPVVERVCLRSDGTPDVAARRPVLPADLEAVAFGITDTGARLVVIDPLSAYLGADVNVWREQDVRRALASLEALAAETGAAVLAVAHLNKDRGLVALYRVGGTIGLVAAPRSSLVVAADPADPARRVVAPLKQNLAAPVPALAFRLKTGPGGRPYVVWEGPSPHTAQTLLAHRPPDGEEERTALAEAADFLRQLLADGPVPADAVGAAARQAGVREITLRRARRTLQIVGRRRGFGPGGRWVWALPAAQEAAPARHDPS